MSDRVPGLSIQKRLEANRCCVIYTFTPDFLQLILEAEGVEKPDDLSEHLLRDLCRRASTTEMLRTLEDIEEQQPGDTAIVIDRDSGGNDVELRSSDVGFEVLRAFAPAPDPDKDLLCDPQYNPVDFEMRLLDVRSGTPATPENSIGTCVLSVTLRPPNLA